MLGSHIHSGYTYRGAVEEMTEWMEILKEKPVVYHLLNHFGDGESFPYYNVVEVDDYLCKIKLELMITKLELGIMRDKHKVILEMLNDEEVS